MVEITIPLDLPDKRLLATEITDVGEYVISVESTLDGTTCHRCGAHITEFHGHDAHLLASVESVCTDIMWAGFGWAVRRLIPDARRVVDRFHVARLYGQCADAVRKRERARLEKELPAAEYEADVAGVTWLLRARAGTLEPEDQAKLERFFARSPQARQAWEVRRELTELFEREMTKEQARVELEAWSARARVCGYESFCKTLENWIEEITNYWVARETSGFVEGLNKKLKVLKRRCYGRTNVEDFHRRIILDVEGPYAFGMR